MEKNNMRCKGENCNRCRKNKLNKAKCWSKWNLCGTCAVRKHPEEYKRNVVRSYKVEHKYNMKALINGMAIGREKHGEYL